MAKRIRDSHKSREDILHAAEAEFAAKGMFGTRIDEIAAKANINKRMIYEYFGNKEELYKAVLISVYGRLSREEIDVLSEDIPCTEAIKRTIVLYFEFLKNNPTYVNLIQWENLNGGKYIKNVDFSGIKDPAFELMGKVIEMGKAQGCFKEDIDTEQVILSLLTYTFAYFSNRYTLSKLLHKELFEDDNIKKRIDTVTDMFLSYLQK